jgi:UDP-N-acetylglucosamine diphosphorylase / glucose-1-phosphate thymidylyltransferase / UDP-N-acetylgalactosamine diphosphorylase / glucosamine-1-phosphate N-acetyltransferase / galactosamine-1-phosphate N-acetyltransferase
MNYIIFEDNKFENLYPLNVLRNSMDIKAGVFSLKERIVNYLPLDSNYGLIVREDLCGLTKSFNKCDVNIVPETETVFFNGRAVFSQRFVKWIVNDMPSDSMVQLEGTVIAAKISTQEIIKRKSNITFPVENKFFDGLKDINNLNFNFENIFDLINYSWDVIRLFDFNLAFDLSYLLEKVKGLEKNPEVAQENENNYVSPSAKVFPGVILDTGSGEIYIDDNAVIEPLSYIKGPVYIGKNTLVKSGSRVYGPCSIGWGSKVSGEISGSLFHSCVNKQHDGFIGNTYACPFVNFGADTVTSNLKNNYSKVRVTLNNTAFNTGMQFLGSIVGDHSKFGINTMLNTGTICGVFANIAGGGFPAKNIDSFSWNILGQEISKYKFNEAVETARIVMKRRGIEMKEEYISLLKKIY